MDDLARLVAKAEIEDCLKRYARGVDRRDWPAVRDCFHEDATDQHGDFTGTGDQFIEWVRKRHANLPFAMHYLLNCLVEFHSPDSAAVETYFWALQRREDSAGKGVDHEVFGRYVDRFEQRGNGWKVAQRQVVYDSSRMLDSTNHLRPMVGTIGRRDAQDAVYQSLPAATE